MKKLKASKSDLAREEWYFESLEDEDVYPCWSWEFNRQVYLRSSVIREALKKIRKGRKVGKMGFLGDPREFSDAAQFLGGHAMYPVSVWPQKPFLITDETLRLSLVKCQSELVSLPGDHQTRAVSQRDLDDPLKSPFGWLGRWQEGTVWFEGNCHWSEPVKVPIGKTTHQTVVAALALDFSKADKVIIEEFSQWLERTRKNEKLIKKLDPEKVDPATRRRGVPDVIKEQRADLKALGALRLCIRHKTTLDAMEASRKDIGAPLFSEEPEWTKARNRAGKIISEIQSDQEIMALRTLSKLGSESTLLATNHYWKAMMFPEESESNNASLHRSPSQERD